MKVIPETRLAH